MDISVSSIVRWKHAKEAAAVLASLLLYVVGVKFLLIPVVIFLNVRYMPMPRVFGSWVSRIFVAFLLAMTMLQVAATAQFLLAPHSNFMALAVLFVIVQVALWWILPKRQAPDRRPWFTVTDTCALLVAVFFLLPFAPILLGRSSIYHIAQIGGIQAIDATNHYAGIAEMTGSQHLTYAPNYYYPKGFHISVGFIENTLFPSQYSLGWDGNAVLYFLQYVFFAGTLAYGAYYLCLGLFGLWGQKDVAGGRRALLACCLGPALALFYLVPLVNQGFLNYYYVILTVIVGLLFLLEVADGQRGAGDDWKKVIHDEHQRWYLAAYFLLIFGASASWPLLIPPLMLMGVLFVLPSPLNLRAFGRELLGKGGVILMLTLALQLIPVYFQLKYGSIDGKQGINATGGLAAFHPYVLLACMALVLALLWGKQLSAPHKKFLMNTFIPFLLFVGLLIVYQYFVDGEVRYYAIKSAILLEILFLALAVSALVYVYAKRSVTSLPYAAMLAAVPLVVMIFLVSSLANPLKDVRDLFRGHSGEPTPDFFAHDDSLFMRLGGEGKVKHFNSTLLHYDQAKQKLYGHEQIPFWANMMQYDSSPGDFQALNCQGVIYSNLAFGDFSSATQRALIAKVKECAAMARNRGLAYYIVTDATSAPEIRALFGDIAQVVY